MRSASGHDEPLDEVLPQANQRPKEPVQEVDRQKEDVVAFLLVETQEKALQSVLKVFVHHVELRAFVVSSAFKT